MTRGEAFELVVRMAAAYPRSPLNEATIELYTDFLIDCDAGMAHCAIDLLIATSIFLPSIAEIRAAVAQLYVPACGPEAAWGELSLAIARCRDQPEFSCAAIAEALRMIGRSWHDLRMLPFEQYPWLRRDFLAAYREATERTRREAQASAGALPPPSRQDAQRALQHVAAMTGVNLLAPLGDRAAGAAAAREAVKSVQQAVERSHAADGMAPADVDARREVLRRQAVRLAEETT